MLNRKGIVFVISAPSGTGKTTICKAIVKEVENIRFSISYTTRERKKGEIDGVDYYFVSRERFRELIDENFFVEWAEVYGNLYGTPWSELERAREEGVDLLLEIDVQGGKNVKSVFPDSVLIFIVPPSLEELRKRLEARGRDSDEEIERRIRLAKSEMEFMNFYDYIVENDKIENAIQKVKCIIDAERVKRERVAEHYLEKIKPKGEKSE